MLLMTYSTITIRSQLPVGYNFIIHKCGTGMTNFNCKPIKMVLLFKYLGAKIDFNLKCLLKSLSIIGRKENIDLRFAFTLFV
ncbi:Uncharacterized protein FWK35_00029725 [Aphis craccivora]|uniref:Uncharacterized protein n=1 Tax=Aphis craccivora TaxID=307492 RepID=A0A6G0Z0C7_APHCR|nr:Uncharacterized protein FWK35_00029725 [Aphis craccivora]